MNNQKELEKKMDERFQQTEERIRHSEAREEKIQHLFRHVLHVLEKLIAVVTLVVMLGALGSFWWNWCCTPVPWQTSALFCTRY